MKSIMFNEIDITPSNNRLILLYDSAHTPIIGWYVDCEYRTYGNIEDDIPWRVLDIEILSMWHEIPYKVEPYIHTKDN